MNITNLKIGDTIKNYKEMCSLLGEKITNGGKSKEAQIKNWERYFQYERQGQKFHILNIYDVPLPKVDRRSNGNRRIYLPYVEKIFPPYLSGLKNKTGYFTKKDLLYILGMTNKFYQNISFNDLLAENSNLTYWQLDKFYQICNYKLSSILFSSLNSLQARKIISCEEQYVIILDSNNTYIANDEEKKIISVAEKKTLNKMGIDNKSFAALSFKLSKFYKEVNSYLNERYRWEGIYKQYKIILLNPINPVEALNENQILLNKLLLNEKVIDAVDKHAEDLCEAQKEKLNTVYNNDRRKLQQEDDIWSEIEPIDKESVKHEYKIFTYPDCFVEVQKMLSQKLLKIDSDMNNEKWLSK